MYFLHSPGRKGIISTEPPTLVVSCAICEPGTSVQLVASSSDDSRWKSNVGNVPAVGAPNERMQTGEPRAGGVMAAPACAPVAPTQAWLTRSAIAEPATARCVYCKSISAVSFGVSGHDSRVADRD